MDDSMETCPNCGAPNNNIKRTADGTPKTIEQLKEWYRKRGLPPYNVTRFFIGENVTERRAFGIYREGDKFIVYKNKDNGQRAIRYQGTDEAYAVNEIYLKLKAEILNQKRLSDVGAGGRGGMGNASESSGCKGCLTKAGMYIGIFLAFIGFAGAGAIGIAVVAAIAIGIYVLLSKMNLSQRAKRITIISIIVLAILIPILVLFMRSWNNGYYDYGGTTYYKDDNDWYYYNSYSNDWCDADDYVATDAIESDYDNYYSGFAYDGDSAYTDFTDSEIYSDKYYSSSGDSGWSSSSWDSDWDSDYDWDSGSSWDSGGSDWGSDW